VLVLLLLLLLVVVAWPTAHPVWCAEWDSVCETVAHNLECPPPGHLGSAKACAQPEEP
jgi:hypothetical protein